MGCDPGVKGAICLLKPSTNAVLWYSTPSTAADLAALITQLNVWRTDRDLARIGLEDVHSLFGMSAKSNFQFGRQLGRLEVLLESFKKPPVTYITPKEWQKAVGIFFPKGSTGKQRKLISFQKAVELYPRQKENFRGPRGGLLDGRIDSLLIAHVMAGEYDVLIQTGLYA